MSENRSKKMGVGIVGCGNISDTYFQNCPKFGGLKVVACADLVRAKAEEKGAKYGVTAARSVDELVTSAEVDIVLNLTTPQSHAEICLKAIKSGKHVFVEKPLGITREEGRKIVAEAGKKLVRIGAAPDTFLGGGLQTCRKLLDDGWIGTPVAAAGFMASHGHEHWHPNPEFTYQKGAGPMFGMGPYYVTALISLLGPVTSVRSSAKTSFPERVITSPGRYGEKFKVNVATHITGIMEFASGVTATLMTSYDIWASNLPRLEIYGSEGTLSLPDPNTFGGPVKIFRPEDKEWRQIPIPYRYVENSRGLGLADMADGIIQNRPHRANGDLAFHALDIMQTFLDAAENEQVRELESRCERPAPLPTNLLEFVDLIP